MAFLKDIKAMFKSKNGGNILVVLAIVSVYMLLWIMNVLNQV